MALVLMLLWHSGVGGSAQVQTRGITLGLEVIEVYPHDPEAYTQGLVYADGFLYESTGLYGRSSLRKVELKTGRVQQMLTLPASVFGEGLALLDERLIQLTWRSGYGFVYDRRGFELLGVFAYGTEGWGLTHDGTRLIMSDGSSRLHFLDPQSFARLGAVTVHDERGPVERLNELEYVEGRVFANVYQTNRIVAIDPQTGRVVASLTLSDLVSREHRAGVGVLNGIAYIPTSGHLLVTGKNWSHLYEIRLFPVDDDEE